MLRVLIIEDYTPLRQALKEGLTEAGFEVNAAAAGDIGLWHATGQPYDVIVLDLMLPGMNGLTVLKELRRQGVDSHVLILTAKDELDDRVKGLDQGADDYLTKPFAFIELLARIKALTRRRRGQNSDVISMGDLQIDTAARTARRGDRVIELTAREYVLLEYLARRSGQVVTRTEIWEQVYAFNDEARSNVVDVYVGYLRKKLEAAGESRLLHTRRGHGYVLEETK